jgi:hypothetical protein
LVAAVAAAVAVAGFAVFASAGPGQQGTSWEFKFSKKGENKPTGSNSDLSPAKVNDQGTPDTSDDRFVAPSKSVIKFPVGSNINTGAKARCKESPSDVQTRRASCPGKTRIGSGIANAVTGQSPTSAGTELVSEIEAFNMKNAIMFVVDPCTDGTGPGTGSSCQPIPSARVVLVGRWKKINTRPTLTVVTPPALLTGGVIITRFQLKTDRINSRRKGSYATTPDTCRNDSWTSTATETYQDGSKQTIRDDQPCNG